LTTFSRWRLQVLPTIVQTGANESAGHPEGGDQRVVEGLAREQVEQLQLLGVGAGEAGLDHVDAERVESVRDAQLLGGRERHPLPLHPVAEGRVVQLDGGHLMRFQSRSGGRSVNGGDQPARTRRALSRPRR
jgi:hypothetical protein